MMASGERATGETGSDMGGSTERGKLERALGRRRQQHVQLQKLHRQRSAGAGGRRQAGAVPRAAHVASRGLGGSLEAWNRSLSKGLQWTFARGVGSEAGDAAPPAELADKKRRYVDLRGRRDGEGREGDGRGRGEVVDNGVDDCGGGRG
ncbi:hypothetical protein AXG93_4421s1350 [Marchantia polymorpha subsp. ruderalis]|uniref:Uncharacterized protein n=1 Tax=Marchantia polymorpha subsp. ruderalis TaxID=1480154 RepID=A0A176WI26_MARPO|nr:hypothetical protein AXG93_4421s1350 [Marchantia polymorpha subsp. ruderalis]